MFSNNVAAVIILYDGQMNARFYVLAAWTYTLSRAMNKP